MKNKNFRKKKKNAKEVVRCWFYVGKGSKDKKLAFKTRWQAMKKERSIKEEEAAARKVISEQAYVAAEVAALAKGNARKEA